MTAPADPRPATARPVTARTAAEPPLSGLGRLYAVVAWFEAFTWAGLLVGMFLKYVTETTEAGVWLFGRLHGGAFVAYGIVALIVAVKHRWGIWRTLVALAAAVPPLTTLLAEWWLRRTGHLSEPAQIPGAPDRRPSFS
jgi:integral membrane protein